jgi:rhodanese-related sulfurtransferase
MFKKNHVVMLALAVFFGLKSVAAVAYSGEVSEKKRTTLGLYLTATEAYELAQKEKVLFIDVRTRAEVNFLGMPTVADVNIPYMELDRMYGWDEKKGVFKMDPNSGFASEIEARLAAKGLTRDDKIIVMCRSGDRSANAANLLAKAGYKNVWSIVDGFEGDIAKNGPFKGQRSVNGWKNSKLPWSYDLSKDKMYFE